MAPTGQPTGGSRLKINLALLIPGKARALSSQQKRRHAIVPHQRQGPFDPPPCTPPTRIKDVSLHLRGRNRERPSRPRPRPSQRPRAHAANQGKQVRPTHVNHVTSGHARQQLFSCYLLSHVTSGHARLLPGRIRSNRAPNPSRPPHFPLARPGPPICRATAAQAGGPCRRRSATHLFRCR
jgi:hypothetical protein